MRAAVFSLVNRNLIIVTKEALRGRENESRRRKTHEEKEEEVHEEVEETAVGRIVDGRGREVSRSAGPMRERSGEEERTTSGRSIGGARGGSCWIAGVVCVGKSAMSSCGGATLVAARGN